MPACGRKNVANRLSLPLQSLDCRVQRNTATRFSKQRKSRCIQSSKVNAACQNSLNSLANMNSREIFAVGAPLAAYVGQWMREVHQNLGCRPF